MINCKDCRFWKKFSEFETESRNKRKKNWGFCLKAETENGVPQAINPLAEAQDYDGYAANLESSPDFGCVMAEKMLTD